MQDENRIQSLGRLSKFLRLLLGIYMAISVIGILLAISVNVTAYDENGPVFQSIIELEQPAAIVGLAVLLVSFIFGGIWIYQSASWLKDQEVPGLQFTPGWCVGYYFIPILNFWKPYQAMCEIWKASSGVVNWDETDVPTYFPIWWFAWLITNLVDQFVSKMIENAQTIPEYITANNYWIMASLIDLVAVALFYTIVKQVTTRMQQMLPSNTALVFA